MLRPLTHFYLCTKDLRYGSPSCAWRIFFIPLWCYLSVCSRWQSNGESDLNSKKYCQRQHREIIWIINGTASSNIWSLYIEFIHSFNFIVSLKRFRLDGQQRDQFPRLDKFRLRPCPQSKASHHSCQGPTRFIQRHWTSKTRDMSLIMIYIYIISVWLKSSKT